MSDRLILRPEAEAFEWYEQRRPGLGESLLLSVEATLEALAFDHFECLPHVPFEKKRLFRSFRHNSFARPARLSYYLPRYINMRE